jgi:hypothetical protein
VAADVAGAARDQDRANKRRHHPCSCWNSLC